jgi:hypothetical protein
VFLLPSPTCENFLQCYKAAEFWKKTEINSLLAGSPAKGYFSSWAHFYLTHTPVPAFILQSLYSPPSMEMLLTATAYPACSLPKTCSKFVKEREIIRFSEFCKYFSFFVLHIFSRESFSVPSWSSVVHSDYWIPTPLCCNNVAK